MRPWKTFKNELQSSRAMTKHGDLEPCFLKRFASDILTPCLGNYSTPKAFSTSERSVALLCCYPASLHYLLSKQLLPPDSTTVYSNLSPALAISSPVNRAQHTGSQPQPDITICIVNHIFVLYTSFCCSACMLNTAIDSLIPYRVAKAAMAAQVAATSMVPLVATIRSADVAISVPPSGDTGAAVPSALVSTTPLAPSPVSAGPVVEEGAAPAGVTASHCSHVTPVMHALHAC
jgi:hypothetical protein